MSTSTIAPCWHFWWSVCLLNVHTTGVLCKWCQCCADAHLNRLLSLREAYVACLWYCSRFIRALYIVVHDECACLFLTIFLPNLNRLLDLCSVFSWQGFFSCAHAFLIPLPKYWAAQKKLGLLLGQKVQLYSRPYRGFAKPIFPSLCPGDWTLNF